MVPTIAAFMASLLTSLRICYSLCGCCWCLGSQTLLLEHRLTRSSYLCVSILSLLCSLIIHVNLCGVDETCFLDAGICNVCCALEVRPHHVCRCLKIVLK
jgi:hypothetical protein